MANAKQVLDVQVSKGITAAQGNEHLRNRSEEAEKYAMSKGNYDPTRKHLNFEIVPGGKVRPIDTSRNIPERIADILGRRGIKDPNEGLVEPKYRTVVNIIFGGSRKRMHELAFGTQKGDFEKGADNTRIKRKSDIERWAKDVYAFVCGRPLLDRPSRILFYFIFSCIYIRQGRTPLFTIIFTGLFRFPLRHRRPVFQLQRSAAALDPAA